MIDGVLKFHRYSAKLNCAEVLSVDACLIVTDDNLSIIYVSREAVHQVVSETMCEYLNTVLVFLGRTTYIYIHTHICTCIYTL